MTKRFPNAVADDLQISNNIQYITVFEKKKNLEKALYYLHVLTNKTNFKYLVVHVR